MKNVFVIFWAFSLCVVGCKNNVESGKIISIVENGNTNELVLMIVSDQQLTNVSNCKLDAPLFFATHKGKVDMVRILLAYGANPNVQDDQKLTPLHWAAMNGFDELAGLLLERGAFVNAEDSSGRTPLHYAASCGRDMLSLKLVNYGAKIDVYDKNGDRPLDRARNYGHDKIVSILEKHPDSAK